MLRRRGSDGQGEILEVSTNLNLIFWGLRWRVTQTASDRHPFRGDMAAGYKTHRLQQCIVMFMHRHYLFVDIYYHGITPDAGPLPTPIA